MPDQKKEQGEILSTLRGIVERQTAVDPDQHTAGPLAHSLPARTALARLRAQATASVASVAAGAPDSLAALGIRANRDGTLAITLQTEVGRASCRERV